MSQFFTTALLVASATAQLTTSMWMPSGYEGEIGYYGSVVAVNDDKTTIALVLDKEFTNSSLLSDIESFGSVQDTLTYRGTTFIENIITTSDAEDGYDYTMSLGCTQRAESNALPVCTYSMNGEGYYSAQCEDPNSAAHIGIVTVTYTADEFGPETVETIVPTVNYSEYIPDYCTEGGSRLPESIAVETVTLQRSIVQTYQVVITAGAEKLSATAGATPTGSGASATATGASASGSGTSGTGPAPSESTGGAARMAPALAGLGAAVAVFVL